MHWKVWERLMQWNLSVAVQDISILYFSSLEPQIYGVEPSESSVLSGGKPGTVMWWYSTFSLINVVIESWYPQTCGRSKLLVMLISEVVNIIFYHVIDFWCIILGFWKTVDGWSCSHQFLEITHVSTFGLESPTPLKALDNLIPKDPISFWLEYQSFIWISWISTTVDIPCKFS